MSRLAKSALLLIALAGVMPLLSGCSGCRGGGGRGDPVGDPDSDIKGIFTAYTFYYKPHQKAPTKLADLTTQEMQNATPQGFTALKSGKYVVVWGVPMTNGMAGGDAGTVLAYEKEAPTSGGKVLMANGDVKKLSASELSAKLKK